MRDADVLIDLLSENYLSLLCEKEDFFEFESDSYRLGFEIIADAMSKALERFDDELFNARPPGWKVKEKARSPFNDGVVPDAETVESRVFLEADSVWVPLQVRGRALMERKQPESFEMKATVAYSGKEGKPGRRCRRDRVVFDAATTPDSFWRQGVGATLRFLEGIPAGRANASLRQAVDYLHKFEGAIDPHGPSMGTMESTNAHVIESRMKSLGGARSAEGGNAMARAHVANGGRLPRPHSPVEIDHKSKWWYV